MRAALLHCVYICWRGTPEADWDNRVHIGRKSAFARLQLLNKGRVFLHIIQSLVYVRMCFSSFIFFGYTCANVSVLFVFSRYTYMRMFNFCLFCFNIPPLLTLFPLRVQNWLLKCFIQNSVTDSPIYFSVVTVQVLVLLRIIQGISFNFAVGLLKEKVCAIGILSEMLSIYQKLNKLLVICFFHDLCVYWTEYSNMVQRLWLRINRTQLCSFGKEKSFQSL